MSGECDVSCDVYRADCGKSSPSKVAGLWSMSRLRYITITPSQVAKEPVGGHGTLPFEIASCVLVRACEAGRFSFLDGTRFQVAAEA